MTTTETADIGIAIYYLSTGLCIGAISSMGSAEGFVNEDTILEAMPMSELGEVFDLENPSRCIQRRGRAIGNFMDEPIPEYLLMSNGLRYEFDGTVPHPLDLTLLRPGQLMLLPGLLYKAPASAAAGTAPAWSGAASSRRSVDQEHPEVEPQVHPED